MDIPVNSNLEEYEIEVAESVVIGEVTLGIGDTVTGEAGTDALVENTGDDKNIILKFTIPRGANGADGDDGVGIASVVLNADYTLTITLTDGTSYTTASIRGAIGPAGPSGDDGYSPEVTITQITNGHRVTITDAEHPTGQSFDVMDGEDGGGSGSSIPVAEATRSSGVLSVTVDGITALSNGVAVAVKLPSESLGSSTGTVKLNVNSLGDKGVFNLSGHQVSLADLSPNEVHVFVYAVTTSYNGNWLMLDTNLVNEGFTYGVVSGSDTSRTMSASGFKQRKGAIVAATFSSAVGANTTLNVNSRGAKAIHYKGSPIVAGVIDSGDTAILMYDGSHWRVLSVDTLGGGGSYDDGDSISY